MGVEPHTYFKQGAKVEYGDAVHASIMVRCTAYGGGAFYLTLYDQTNSAELAREELAEVTTDYVQLQVSAWVPIGCTNVEARWGWMDAVDGTYWRVDKARMWRDSAMRLAE